MKKIIYRIFLSSLTVLLVFVFFIGGMPPFGFTHYDSLEELQAAFPDYYYFDVDLPEKTFNKCCAEYEDNIGCFNKRGDYYGYYILYNYKHIYSTIDDATFVINSNSRRQYDYWANYLLTSGFGYLSFDYIIDNIECIVIYRFEENYDCPEEIKFEIMITFEIDNVAYELTSMTVFYKSEKPEDEILIDYFLSLATPAIENRYKIS